MVLDAYQHLRNKHEGLLKKLNRRNIVFGWFRLFSLILFFVFLYQYLKSNSLVYLILSVISTIVFIVLLKYHKSNNGDKKLREKLLLIVENEIKHLNGDTNLFDNGKQYIDYLHLYTHDLDIFGSRSLYGYLNRTATYLGGKILSDRLKSHLPINNIKDNQQATKELTNKLEWRHEFLALSSIANDDENSFKELISWSSKKGIKLNKSIIVISYITPLLLFIALGIAIFSMDVLYLNIAIYIFIFNLLVLSTQRKKILQETFELDKINQSVKYYGLLLKKIEEENFESDKLKKLQSIIYTGEEKSSTHLSNLSRLLLDLHTIGNLIGALLFNGFFLYHIRVLKKILKWKKEHGNKLNSWLEVIGEIEMLNSLANLAYNNPTYIFPEINQHDEITLVDMGHPLIDKEKCVINSVSFIKDDFIILTGSNMSGKSTFLRTIGINMVLSGMGSVIFATEATIHPKQLLVSMRQNDSLSENESYFFAEVKRLKHIIDILKKEDAFVLLDEILRGTNSNDKHDGTIGFIKKLLAYNAMGVIATHDLEVCELEKSYSKQIRNQCFEVDFLDDNLHFDYKLRPGVCKNKSATFLMEKMDIV